MKLDLTTLLAVWGALLSSIAIGWNLYRDLTDKGKLTVTCYVGNLIGGIGPPDKTDYLFWIVTNTGRRPVMATHVGGAKAKENFIKLARSLPKMLQPGEYVTEYTDDLSILNEDLKYLAALDSSGRVYKIPRKALKRLKNRSKRKQI